MRRSSAKTSLSFDRLESRQVLASIAPIVAADYQGDFQGVSFPQNWEYLWNAPEGWVASTPGQNNGSPGDKQTGLITDHPGTFDALNWNTNAWTPDSDLAGDNSDPANFLKLRQTAGAPGNRSGGVDRFAIAAFEIQDSGFYTIEDSLIGLANSTSSTDGVAYRVFVNDQAPLESGIATGSIAAGQSAYGYFDTELGFLKTGDNVYVAIGSNITDSFDSFELDYSIVRHPGRELTAENFVSGSLSAGWQHTIENSGLYGIQGSDVTAGGVSVSIAVDNNNSISTDDALFSLTGLSGTDSNPDNDSFDLSLGYLRKGDTVSISGNVGNVSDDFSLIRVVPREAPDVSFADSVNPVNVFDVQLPHNTIDAFPVLNHAIDDALAHVATLRAAGNMDTVEVRLEPGTYHLNSANDPLVNGSYANYFFLLDNTSNMVINGNGSTIVTTDDFRGLFRLFGSENVVIKDLTVDYAQLTRYFDGSEIVDIYKPVTFTQGVIKAVESGTDSILLDVDTTEFFEPTVDFVPTFSGEGGFWGFPVDPVKTGRLKTNAKSNIYTTEFASLIGVSPDDTGDGTLKRFRVTIGNGMDGLAVNDGYVMQRRKGSPIFGLFGTTNVSLQRIQAWSAPSLFMISRNSALNNVLDSHVMIRPNTGRWNSINADAVHVQSDFTGVWVEDSSFYGVSDDVMNFYSSPSTVHEFIGGADNELVIGEFNINTETNFSADDLHKPGDTLVFLNPLTGLKIGEARVVTSAKESKQFFIAGMNQFRPVFRITLDQPVSGIVEGSPGSSSSNNQFFEGYGNDTLVFNISINQGFVVQDSVLADSRRYGNFVMASNVNLVDNVYQGIPDQAIAGHSELAWPLGAHPRHVLVQGNQFRDVGFSIEYLNDSYHQGVVSFFMDRVVENPNGTEDRAFVDSFADEIKDIQIRDNVFELWSKRAMLVRNGIRVTIEDNDIFGTNSVAGLGNPINNLAFELNYNRELAIANNRVTNPPAFQTNYAVGQNQYVGAPEPLEPDAANDLMLEPARVVSMNRAVRDDSRMDLLTSFSITFDRAVNGNLLASALTLAGITLDPLSFQYDVGLRTATWSNFRVNDEALDPGNYQINIDTSAVGVTSPSPIDFYLAIPGDADLSQNVDVLGDAFIFNASLNTPIGDPIIVETTWRMADFDGDNDVDVLGDGFVMNESLNQSV